MVDICVLLVICHAVVLVLIVCHAKPDRMQTIDMSCSPAVMRVTAKQWQHTVSDRKHHFSISSAQVTGSMVTESEHEPNYSEEA